MKCREFELHFESGCILTESEERRKGISCHKKRSNKNTEEKYVGKYTCFSITKT